MLTDTCLCFVKFFNNNQNQSKKRRGRSKEVPFTILLLPLHDNVVQQNNRWYISITLPNYILNIQEYFEEYFENIGWSHRTTFKQKSIGSLRNFLPRETYCTKQVAVTHRNTVTSHLIYLKFAFAPVCIVSNGRLFVHKENMACVSELQFSCNHNYVATKLKIDYSTFQNLFDLGLE